MIEQLVARNFKSLRDIEAGFEPFTVFVGPNASGKSSVLQALELVCRAFSAVEQPPDHEMRAAQSRGHSPASELTAKAGGVWHKYAPPATAPNTGLGFGNPSVEPSRMLSADATDPSRWTKWPADVRLTARLPRAVLLRLETSKLISSTVNTPDPSHMMPDGSGIHSALANMALNDPDSWQALQADLHGIIPNIRRLRHTNTGPNRPPALLFDTQGAAGLTATDVSEGTLLVLGLLTALYSPDRPGLVLLDDLDRGLHPRAQHDLIVLLRRLLAVTPGRQIVATTHSPYMLNYMQPSEVRLTDLREDGATVCARLDAHPQFQKWTDELSPGEMWSIFGEKWVAGREAAA